MSLIAVVSAKGSPGVSTTALALARVWASASGGRRALVLDADVAGSGLASGLLSAPTAEVGLLALAAARTRLAAGTVLAHAVALDEASTVMVLLGVSDPAQARAVSGLWPAVAPAARDLHAEGVDVLADVGRLGTVNEPLAVLEDADLVVLLTGSDLVSLSAARPALRRLDAVRGAAGGVVVAVAGEHRPYSGREIAAALGVEVGPVLAHDPAAARTLLGGGGGGRLERTALLRSAHAAAGDLVGRLRSATSLDGASR